MLWAMHDDDLHDRGLLFDLQTMAARRATTNPLPRRRLLQLAGMGTVGLVLAACGKDSSGTAATTTTSGSSGSTTSTSTTAAGGGPVTPTPEETGGPFP